MNCIETRDWLDALIDGELDLGRSVEIERHLLNCPTCAASRDSMVALRERFRSATFRPGAPLLLERRVRSALRHERGATNRAWQFISYVAIAASLILALWIRIPHGEQSSNEFALNELVAAHVRSTQVDHLTDVVSADQHTVKPWFEGKLDYSPRVRDLAAEGFVLVGGRMDYLSGRNVASIVYQRNKHLINVFIRPEHGPNQRVSTESSEGFNVVRWRKESMSFSAISDLNATELSKLAQLIAADP